jgi:hypothetical protein
MACPVKTPLAARLTLILLAAAAAPLPLSAAGIEVLPPQVALHGHFDRVQLLARDAGPSDAQDRAADRTREATFASSKAQVVSVTDGGQLLAVSNGTAEVVVTVGKESVRVPVTVDGVGAKPEVTFDGSVRPILSRAGCNMGACHASQYGQGGFVLSVFGFDPRMDYEGIIRDREGRRVNLVDPEKSLVLLKPTMQVPHGGGQRLRKGSTDYNMLVAWLKNGSPGVQKDAPKVTGLRVEPARRVAAADRDGDGKPIVQQLRVEATYSDGRVRDVTSWAKFDTLDDAVAAVSPDGLVTTQGRGQGPVMVRFENQAAMTMFVVPFAGSVELAGWQSNNFVDELAAAKFRELGLEPSGLCDDATFLRRAFLDATGTLPTVAESKAFLADPSADKRERLVDRLLGLTGDPAQDIYNDQYAAYWTLKWSDLIRNNSQDLGEQGMWALHNWLKESFRTNRPFDEFVRELVTAKGSIYSSGPANYFRVNKNANELAESTAQLFLGVRLQCAQCHHHPFENYSQADYYSFAAFFSRVGTKNSEDFGLFGRESVVLVKSSGSVRHPRTGQVMEPTPLGGEPVTHDLDLRIPLAQWLTAPENELFARSIVNRYVGYLLGRGLVEPIDDMRATNPASNPELLEALAAKFREDGCDVKKLMWHLMTSRLYQLSSQPTELNAADGKFFSHAKVRRIPAEPLLVAIDRATASETKFKSLPPGTRAIELPDAEYPNYFLTTFAKPRRATVCECERMPDENLAQALHTLNGDILARKIADKDGRIAELLKAKTPHEEIVTQLYLATLCRQPTAAEREAAGRFLKASPSPKECYEDLLWALINSKHFLFVR